MKSGRPTQSEAIAIQKRNEEILAMDQKGYPLDYIAAYYSLSKGRVVNILNKMKRNIIKEKE